MADHISKRPWTVKGFPDNDPNYIEYVIEDAARATVATMFYETADGAAAAYLIVRAVNAHDHLVKACEFVASWLESFAHPPAEEEKQEVLSVLEAALSQARGDSP
jgi:hypothetical protein